MNLNLSLAFGNWEIQIGDVLKSCTVILICVITTYSIPKYTSREAKSKCSTVKR